MQINERVERIPLSKTLALDARAKQLAAEGRDIINLTAGEPDFDSPRVVREAAKSSIDAGRVKYTPAAGHESLRATIATHLSRTRGVAFEAEEITVCHSGKHALSGALLALVREGDEVLLLLPAWVSYVEQIRFAGGRAVGVAPRADMGPDFAAVLAAIGPRTRGMMINSPNNPSGYVCTREELAQLVAIASEHDLWILSDEIYARLTYTDGAFCSPVQFGAEARARTVIVDGASKTFSMTGYRIGFVAGPVPLASAVARLHSQLTGSPNAISQEAFAAALETEPPEVEEMLQAFRERRDLMLSTLDSLGFHTPRPAGAFYVFPSIRGHWPEDDADRFCDELLEREGLALVPGSAFGVAGHVRFSYAASLNTLEEGLKRFARFVGRCGD